MHLSHFHLYIRDSFSICSEGLNHNRLSALLYLFLSFCFPSSRPLYFGRFFRGPRELQLFRALSALIVSTRYPRRAFPNTLAFKYSDQSNFPDVLGRLNPSSYQSVDQRADTNRGCISKSSLSLFFSLLPFHQQPPFAFLLSMSLRRSCFLYPFTRYPICCTLASATVVCREVCVIGKAGKGTFIERPPFLVLHRFTCCVRS